MGRTERILAGGFLSLLVAGLCGVLVYTAFARPHGSPTTPFELAATTGDSFRETDLKGRQTLLYFGYTHCPEVCPTTLYDMSQWFEALGEEGRDLQAYFVTIDPERDTLAVLEPYVAAFSDRIVGVTGDPAEVRAMTEGWLVTADMDVTAEGYSMSHTASVLMVGADGRLAGLIPYLATPEQATAKIRDVLLAGRTS